METTIREEIEALRHMTVAQLKKKYTEVFGEETRSHHKHFLFRRIAWRIQALAEGGLSERARRRALEIAHFDPETGANRERAPGSKEACEAACYDCLMSYTNQPDHPLLDRKLVADILLRMTKASVAVAPGAQTREEAFERLLRQAGSELERKWLRFLMTGGFRLPTDAQKLFPQAGTRPDFIYAADSVVIYVDGPPHDFPDRQARDAVKQAAMEDLGYIVLRFRHDADWEPLLKKYPSVFGGGA